jgi:hypothetical protein
MYKKKFDKYYHLLQIEKNCSFEELLSSYNHLKKLYSTNSIAIIPLNNELSKNEKMGILAELDQAFEIISGLIKQDKQSPLLKNPGPKKQQIIESPAFSGAYFKAVRENLKLDLQQISFLTKISKFILHNIESENFHKLPHAAYLKCQVKTYAVYLNLNADTASAEYMKKYYNWERKMKITY